MNIGIVCYPTYGGSGIVATELGKSLAKKGHQIHVISYQQPVRLDVFKQNISYHEVNVSDYPLFEYQPYESALCSKLVDVAIYEKLDIIHVHYAIPHAPAAYMAQQILKSKGIEIPFVTTLHGTDITLVGNNESFEPVISFSLEQSNAVTAVSESLKTDTYKYFQIEKKIQVIHNFISLSDYDRFDIDPELIERFAKNGERIVMHSSNFRKIKRVEDVVAVFDKIQQEIPAVLVLLGDGPERSTIQNLCRKRKICHKVFCTGKIKKVEKVLKIADLFLMTSGSESFGLAALEAMAAQTPVVSTNVGGLPECNKDGYSGYTCDLGDIDCMAEKSIEILESTDVLEKRKKQAYDHAKAFEKEKIIPQYEELYYSLIDNEKK